MEIRDVSIPQRVRPSFGLSSNGLWNRAVDVTEFPSLKGFDLHSDWIMNLHCWGHYCVSIPQRVRPSFGPHADCKGSDHPVSVSIPQRVRPSFGPRESMCTTKGLMLVSIPQRVRPSFGLPGLVPPQNPPRTSRLYHTSPPCQIDLKLENPYRRAVFAANTPPNSRRFMHFREGVFATSLSHCRRYSSFARGTGAGDTSPLQGSGLTFGHHA